MTSRVSKTVIDCMSRVSRAPRRQLSTQLTRCYPLRENRVFATKISARKAITQQIRLKSDNANSETQDTLEPPASKIYSYSEIKDITKSPSPTRILIDVREPSELQSSGHVPGAKNLPINSAPEGLFLPADDFEEKFGWPKPRNTDELVFYCKAGVRSRAAAGFAKRAGWTKVGEYPGSWLDWVENGGKIERD